MKHFQLVLTSSHRQPLDIDLLLEQIGECKTTRTTQQVLIVDYSILILMANVNSAVYKNLPQRVHLPILTLTS